MRTLVLGAGGTGGYFGGRLAQSGANVTFLVREGRGRQLARDGLRIRSPLGDADLDVAYLAAHGLVARVARHPFDLVLLACKAYDLDSAIDAIAPAVGDRTAVLPILNGLLQYDTLDARFGASRAIGGLCFISVVKADDGTVQHLGTPASITFGERDPASDPARLEAFAALCATAGIDHVASPHIARAQWIKFTFLCALAAATCTMRASIGVIVGASDGDAYVRALYAECVAVAEAQGQPIPADAQVKALGTLTAADSDLKASMLRDLQAGQRVEAAHIVGDMLHRARASTLDAPLLLAAWVHLQAYESIQGVA